MTEFSNPVNDIRFALRQLLKSPGFTFLAVLRPTLDLAFVGVHGAAASRISSMEALRVE